jgi:hypothetical protein
MGAKSKSRDVVTAPQWGGFATPSWEKNRRVEVWAAAQARR